MTYSRLDPGKQRYSAGGAPPLYPAAAGFAGASLGWPRTLFIVFTAGVLFRIFLVDDIINGFWAYTKEGGIFPGKIHPGSYCVFAAAGLLYLAPGYRFAGRDLPVLRALILFTMAAFAAAMIPMAQGRNGPAGYVIDVYFAVSAACVFLLGMPPPWRRILGLVILIGLGLNCLIAIGEFATGRYILPAEAAEFRPAGLLGAALNAGVLNLTAAVMLLCLPVHWVWKYGLTALLMAGVLISGSRTAMLVAVAVLPLAILMTARLRNEGASMGAAAILMGIFAISVLPLLYLLVDDLGFLDRFKSGYIDDNAQVRIEIYRVFEFVGWRDIIIGTDILTIRKIAQEILGIQLIESAIVFFVFDFGLIGMAIFSVFFLWLLWRIGRSSHPVIGLGLLVFLALALTNNTLSTKVPSTFAALILGVALSAFHRGRDDG